MSTSSIVARIETLTTAYLAAHEAAMTAMRASRRVTAALDDSEASEDQYAEARRVAGLPTAAEEGALFDAMDRARVALASALRKSAKQFTGKSYGDASDVAIVELWVRGRAKRAA